MGELIRDRFEVVEQVGGTGRARVAKAKDVLTDLPCAIKSWTLPADADKAAIMGQLRPLMALRPHPALPQVRDGFFEGDAFHLVMDWVEGGPAQPGVTASRVLELAAATAEAVDALHAAGVPHRDIRPQNIMVVPDGTVVLVGYGLPLLDEGTRPWTAPEVVGGQEHSPSSDVWSLAAAAFTLLTGASPEVAQADWDGHALSDALPLERAIRRALALAPAERPPTAAELVARLKSWAETALPTGVITLLMTDVQGSTRLWEGHPAEMSDAVARHDELFAEVIERHGGHLLKTRGEGDAIFSVFANASAAVAAAGDAQRAIAAEPWPEQTPIRVRIGLHTGEAEIRQGDYYGGTVNRCARIKAVGHGGQILCSEATADVVRDALPDGLVLTDLGSHRLKDLSRPERIFQVGVEGIGQDFPPLASLDASVTNLPVQTTAFVGREEELSGIRDSLGAARLVTLVGAGGCGKTRLALQVAADVMDAYPDGVWWIDLGPLSEGPQVAQAVAGAIGAREEPGRTIADSVIDALRERTSLLILDNCEHLVEPVATFVSAILGACRRVSMIATSREPLAVQGEASWRIPSLAAPAPGASVTADEALASPAVRLFADRAALVKPGFEVTPQNAGPIMTICHQLDGIPLAIELAAARVKMVTPEEIAKRLDDRFRVVAGGSRSALPRQQTLRAAIDWSYDLLGPEERLLFARVSAFVGGFTFEAAEQVCADEQLDVFDLFDRLGALVDKSLVVAEDRDGATRYSMLQSILHYAREKLGEAGGSEVRDRHLAWAIDMLREGAALFRSDRAAWLGVMDTELGNLRAGIAWASEQGRPGDALYIALTLQDFWQSRGYLAEGRVHLEAAASSADLGAARRLSAMVGVAQLCRLQGDNADADRTLVQAEELARAEGESGALAAVLRTVGERHLERGDLDAAQVVLSEALELSRGAGGDTGWLLVALGDLAAERGDIKRARTDYEEALALARSSSDDVHIAMAQNALGLLAKDEGDLEIARASFEEVEATFRRLGDRLGESVALLNLGEISMSQGDLDRAQELLLRSLEMKKEFGERQGIAICTALLGVVAAERADAAEARILLAEALASFRDLGETGSMIECVEELALLEAASGSGDEAVRLEGIAADARTALGIPLPPAARARIDEALAPVRNAAAPARAGTWQEALDALATNLAGSRGVVP